jgi:hypothetical protein
LAEAKIDYLPRCMLLPNDLEDAIEQAIAATFAAVDAGCTRIQVDIKFPELAQLPMARQFADRLIQKYGNSWQALFSDAGSAALAKRDWSDLDISMRGVNEGRAAVKPETLAFLLVAPTSLEVDRIEKLWELVGDRPVIMLNPNLENSEVGLGLAARRVRDRFLSIFEISYYVQPLEGGALWRAYPQSWQVYQEREEGMTMIFESWQRPVGDELTRILTKATGKKPSLVVQMQRFFNALGRQ